MQPFKVFTAAIRRLRGNAATPTDARFGDRPVASDLRIAIVERPLNDITQHVMRAKGRQPDPFRKF